MGLESVSASEDVIGDLTGGFIFSWLVKLKIKLILIAPTYWGAKFVIGGLKVN